MATKISTNNGEFVIVDTFDYLTGKSYYEVYMPNDEECNGEYVGDYTPQFNIDDEYEEFIEDFEMWLDDNNIVNI